MDISLSGIEQAVEGLGYRNDKSPKSRLVYTLRQHYLDSGAVESICDIDTDTLIDLMWDLGGDKKAIRSKRKNLSSIKSSVNADLDAAWELGHNPEGITIGAMNTFVMSDAAKDKILNSFSGSMNLGGGDSLDRVAEALKIVSEYLSNLPGGLEDDKLSNLKSLVEGLAEKFQDGAGPGEFEIIPKRDGALDKTAAELPESEVSEEELDDAGVTVEDIIDEDSDPLEIDDTENVEVMEEEILEDENEEEEVVEDETELDEIAEDDLDDYEEVMEEDTGALEDEEEIIEVLEDEYDLDRTEEAAIGEEESDIEDLDEAEELIDDGADFEESVEEMREEAELEEAVEEIGAEESDGIEFLDENPLVEDEEAVADLIEDGMEISEVDEAELDDVDDVSGEQEADFEEDDIVEVMDASDVSELDEVDILEDDDVLDEVDEAGDDISDDEAEPHDAIGRDDVGLPLDQLAEEALNFVEFQPDEEQKRLLAERFDGYLGAMERYYNQYIIVKKGRYTVGADGIEGDVLEEQKITLPDFYMGKYPVTNALFEVFIERTGYKTTAEQLGYGYVYQGRFQKKVDPETGMSRSIWNPSNTRQKVDGATWYQPTGPGSTLYQKRNHPVVQVSIKDARTFAAWTGKRLPTEFEWEAAARTQSGFLFPWGNEWQDGCCNLENSGLSDTCPVDANLEGNNETGLADLLGNVLEWTASECQPKYPMEKSVRFFIAKGGSWASHEKISLFERARFGSEFTANILGFRCLAD